MFSTLGLSDWAAILLIAAVGLSYIGPKLYAIVRDRVVAWWPAKKTPVTTVSDSEIMDAYRSFRFVLDAVKDCPLATEAMQRIVLPAIVTKADPPHYAVMWEGKS